MNIESLYDRLEKVAYYSNVPEELAYMITNITPKECAEILRHFREQNEEIERLNNRIEKAVEYVKECYTQPPNIENFMHEGEMNYLLNILDVRSDE